MNPYAWTFSLALLAIPALAQENEVKQSPPEQILIVGQRPGPGLWKVSKGDHVLWVFGSYAPLPKKMTWRSQQVEQAIAQSQEILGPPGTAMSVGYADSLNIITALPFLVGVKNNADGASLQEIVPADVYARWTALKLKYVGQDSGIERERPMFAAQELYAKALEKSGLGNDRHVVDGILDFAKAHKVKYTATTVSLPLENPRQALRDFKKTRLEDLECFTKTIDRLETDLDAMRVRANAWAIGDVDKMRQLTYPDQVEACKLAMTGSAWMKALPGAGALEQRVRDSWLAAAEKSLATNRSTFALLPVSQLMNATGMLAELQARGYQVEQPD